MLLSRAVLKLSRKPPDSSTEKPPSAFGKTLLSPPLGLHLPCTCLAQYHKKLVPQALVPRPAFQPRGRMRRRLRRRISRAGALSSKAPSGHGRLFFLSRARSLHIQFLPAATATTTHHHAPMTECSSPLVGATRDGLFISCSGKAKKRNGHALAQCTCTHTHTHARSTDLPKITVQIPASRTRLSPVISFLQPTFLPRANSRGRRCQPRRPEEVGRETSSTSRLMLPSRISQRPCA